MEYSPKEVISHGDTLYSKPSSMMYPCRVDPRDLNKLIMNYLVIEGYKDAAEKFHQESGIKPGMSLDSMEARMLIRSAIEKGQIEHAIDLVNDLDPEVSQ